MEQENLKSEEDFSVCLCYGWVSVFVLYNSPEDQDISASACTIDELELLTGLDFYHNLDDKTEKQVEARIDWKYWKGVGVNPWFDFKLFFWQ